ncbi:MAG: asparaginase domain-containing protein [Marinifilaceae bacterium]
MHITFIQTGGTIDKDYPRTSGGWAFEIDEPAVHRILEKLNPSFTYEVISVLKKDSQEITNEDRELIVNSIKTQKSDKIIITHGTDTIRETAQYLNQIEDKLIILTGAMKPERFSNSDAPITLGTAIGAANVLKKGVYIAMHGKVLPFNEIQRNTETGQYY